MFAGEAMAALFNKRLEADPQRDGRA